MITLTQLEYIVAIDEYRHFATAAEKCFVTQPTLSMQIKKLEDELGVIIFDRSRQPVVPTDLGAKLIEQARMTLSATQRIKGRTARGRGNTENRNHTDTGSLSVTGFHRALYPQISGSKSRGRRIGLRRDHSPAET
jgi:DNA-binding transcriptional LysR family regulator